MTDIWTKNGGNKAHWTGVGKLPVSQIWTCGYCGKNVGSNNGWSAGIGVTEAPAGCVAICPVCGRPTFFSFLEGEGVYYPVALPGKEMDGLPDDVEALYREARICIGVGAYTSAVLNMRKLLMHVAVAGGAKEGETFAYYSNYIIEHHVVPESFRRLIDQLKDRGNDANHQIILMSEQEATQLLAIIQTSIAWAYAAEALEVKSGKKKKKMIVSSAGSLNVRSSPEKIEGNVVGTLSKGTIVEVAKQSGEWSWVDGNPAGWVMTEFLEPYEGND
jgi:hypothetical protein